MTSSTGNAWQTWPRAASARIETGRLIVGLTDGREISVPIDWFDFLATATEVQRQDFEITDDNGAIFWEQLDDSLSVPGLLGLPEYPPPDPKIRSYTVDYRREDDAWIADVRGTNFSTFGRSLPVAKRHARDLLRAYLEVNDLHAAGIEVVDEVRSPEAVKA